MTNKKAFVAVTESYALVSRFLPGIGNRDFFVSYVTEFPELTGYDMTCFWASGGYATRMKRAGLAPHLVAPGQLWLSTVDEKLLGRRVVTESVASFKESHKLGDGRKIFAKPAEAKVESLKASVYAVDEVLEILESEDIPENTLIQWTTEILPLNYEHRFFIAHKKIYTGSPYLIDGEIYTSRMVSPCYGEALNAVEEFLGELGDNQPPAFTLDVALNEDTREWVIVEANPVWSSGLYGAEPDKVLEVLEVACNAGKDAENKDWLWVPAEYLVNLALEAPLMKIVSDVDKSSAVFKLHANS